MVKVVAVGVKVVVVGFDELPSIMNSFGIDALYDRSNDAFAVYNLKILSIL